MARLRPVAMTKALKNLSDEVYLSHDDQFIDFSSAGLYLVGLQTTVATVACAATSVASCWLMPSYLVSAVRTLAFCAATGALLMRTPLRVGRAHGVRVVFASLQPAVPLYLTALVIEQLVHTCTSDTSHAPSWRRVVFHGMILVMLAAGAMRAREPLRDTDMPFLLTAGALLVIALMPPPAVALVGPLCQAVTMWEAADRLVRAFSFAGVYCAHVYALTANTSLTSSETLIVVTRSGSAALWTMGAHVLWLPAAIAQCGVVIMARIAIENGSAYRSLPDAAPPDDDVELGAARVAVAEAAASPRDRPAAAAAAAAPHLNQQQHALLQALDQKAAHVDVLQQQRELLAQPSAVAKAFPNESGEVERREPAEAPGGAGTTAPADLGFGPLAFREVAGPAADPPPLPAAPPPPPAAYGGGPMTAARMAEIAATIPDDNALSDPALDAGRGA